MSLFENILTAMCVLCLLVCLFNAYRWAINLGWELQHYRDKKARLDFFHRLAAAEYHRGVKAWREGDQEALLDSERRHNLLHLRFQRELADYYSRKS